MKITHEKSLFPPDTSSLLSRIECLSWSPSGSRLAVCTSNNNQVTLFSGGPSLSKKEKFALKAVDKNFSRKSFSVKGLAFSPEGTRLAVGQTDGVIYVYKVGGDSAETRSGGDSKKSIVAKYTLQSACTSVIWHESGIIFGTMEGKVKIVQSSTNRMANVISSNSMVVSMSLAGNDLAVGFVAGAVVVTTLGSKETSRQVGSGTSPPFALTLTTKGFACFGGGDGKVNFINVKSSGSASGRDRQTLDLGGDINCAASAPTGNVVVFGSSDRLILFKCDNYWKQFQTIECSGGHLITGIEWTNDGTRMAASTVNGAIELFSFHWKKKTIGDKYAIDFVGGNQVVVTDKAKGLKGVFKSRNEIEDVKVSKENFVIIRTQSSLVIGDLRSPTDKVSEVEWDLSSRTTTGIRYCFDYEGVVLLNVVGELYIIELGVDGFLSSVRTDFVNPKLMSVRINERKSGVKVLAYLLDLKTIAVTDLTTNAQLCVWNHDSRIEWIELNETGKLLLFRDRGNRLSLLNISMQESQVILPQCSFVNWVPSSDVIVAQSGERVYVWYDLSRPLIHDIPAGSKGEVSKIVREKGTTRVVFSDSKGDGLLLDEALLEFDTAIQDGDLQRAAEFLESVPLSPDSESMWRSLGKVALKNNDLKIAERAFAAVGDVSRAAFIRESEGDLHQLALLEKDWSTFEIGTDFQDVIDTYTRINKWTRAIDYAGRMGRQDVQEDLEDRYLRHLLETGQEAEAGAIKERHGDLVEAIKLYRSSGRLALAARVIVNSVKPGSSEEIPQSLIKSIVDDLKAGQFYGEAGDVLLLALDDPSSALDIYVKGKCFSKAIDLAREQFPDDVVSLEGKFGEYLMGEGRDPSSAVSHLIEAGKTERALEAAIVANQFDRAAEISSVLDSIPSHFGKQIADYFSSRGDLESAVEMLIKAGSHREAVSVLSQKGQYSRSLKLARKILPQEEVGDLFSDLASSFVQKGDLKEAEKVFLTIGDSDAAISMYKKAEQFDNMIRLVKQSHPDLLMDTHVHLAKELEAKERYRDAEGHYLSASDFKSVIQMYSRVGNWEDAYRVARSHAGSSVARQVAFLWAQSVPNPSESVRILSRLGLLHSVIDYAIETNNFDFAMGLIQSGGGGGDLQFKEQEIRLKQASFLDSQGRRSEAETLLIQAGRAKEAVIMYVRANQFSDALRVAELHIEDDSVLSDILIAQAKHTLETEGRDIETLSRVEGLLIRAHRPELAVKMYRDAKLWEEGLRVAESHAPNLVEHLKREMVSSRHSVTDGLGLTPTSSRAGSRAGSRLPSAASRPSTYNARGSLADIMDNESPSMAGMEQPRFEDVRDLKRALETAEKSGDRGNVLRLSLMLATQLVREKDPVQAIAIISGNSGVITSPEGSRLITKIAADMFSFDYHQNPPLSVWRALRDSLLQLVQSKSNPERPTTSRTTGRPSTAIDTSDTREREKLLLISHYLVLKTVLTDLRESHPSSNDLLLKLTIALLRYTSLLRVDKAFYEAGKVAKEADRLDMAFVFWNHYLDLVDAIEERDLNVDHSDLERTDIPSEFPLPSDPFYRDPSITDEVKSWILQVSMDSIAQKVLPSCPFREGEVYEASLVNPSDGSRSLPCIVTGYPVIKHKMMELKAPSNNLSGYAANKEDWNRLLMLTKMSGSDDLKDVLLFVGRLCGNASVARFSFQ